MSGFVRIVNEDQIKCINRGSRTCMYASYLWIRTVRPLVVWENLNKHGSKKGNKKGTTMDAIREWCCFVRLVYRKFACGKRPSMFICPKPFFQEGNCTFFSTWKPIETCKLYEEQHPLGNDLIYSVEIAKNIKYQGSSDTLWNDNLELNQINKTTILMNPNLIKLLKKKTFYRCYFNPSDPLFHGFHPIRSLLWTCV